MNRITPQALREWILDGNELALLDAREDGEFGRRHLFWANPCPLSTRETRIPRVLPCKSTRIVCMDEGNGEAAALASYLQANGYTTIHTLAGGVQAWADAGYVLFSQVNVPSKAFGEWVEHHYETESIDASELAAWQADGRDMVLLDSRTFEEFHRWTLPGSMNVPGGELVYRIGDLAPNPETTVVVHCAGRTRSIMGAESLRRAGIPNKVVALRNGTMGWVLAGLACLHGRDIVYPPGTPRTADTARARAESFAASCGVRALDPASLARLQADTTRTLYLLDVREPNEYATSHTPGSLNAPGGQLVQATDEWIAVRNCRIALFDEGGTRARMAAAWLRHMGYDEVYVADLADPALHAKLVPAQPAPQPPLPPSVTEITPHQLAAEKSPVIIDIGRSIDFRAAHIPGARWHMRRELPALDLPPAAILVSPDGAAARRAAADLPGRPLRILAGGTKAWVAAGLPLQSSPADPPDEACLDFYLRPQDHVTNPEQAMQAYLTWEIDLVGQLQRDGTVNFREPT